MRSRYFGDLSEEPNGGDFDEKKKSSDVLKNCSEDDKRLILHNIYNLFNHGRADQKPAFAKWVTSGHASYSKLIGQLRDKQELLSRFSVSIVGSHHMKDPNSERSEHIRDVIELIGLTDGFVRSIEKARLELDTGFGRLFKLTTDASDVAAYEGDAFEEKFGAYADDFVSRLQQTYGSKATPEDHEKWYQRLGRAEDLFQCVRDRQIQFVTRCAPASDDGMRAEL